MTHRDTEDLGQTDDPIAEQHWAVSMTEAVCVAGCTCIFCASRPDADSQTDHTRTTPRSRPRRHIRRSLPSTASIMEVLYPLSYLGTPPVLPDPPSYFPGDAHPSTSQGNYRDLMECTRLISTTVTTGGIRAPPGHHNLLVEASSLTGIPSPAASGRIPPAEPNAPIAGLGINVLAETEPPPAYSRFDEGRSHLPVASDLFGPYPHISVLVPPAP